MQARLQNRNRDVALSVHTVPVLIYKYEYRSIEMLREILT